MTARAGEKKIASYFRVDISKTQAIHKTEGSKRTYGENESFCGDPWFVS